MSVRLALAGDAGLVRAGEAEMAAFLGRLVRWDKAAVVRLRSAEGEPALGVFGHPPFGGVLAVKSMALTGRGIAETVDATVSVGQLLDAVDAAADGGEFTVPGSVTGPAWAGLLPPRGGWRRTAELDPAAVREAAARIVAEFRARTEALASQQRTRDRLDALAEELWSRTLPGPAADVPLRLVHAAHALGYLQRPHRFPEAAAPAATQVPAAAQVAGPAAAADPARTRARHVRGDEAVAVLSAGPWTRLRTVYGSVAIRGASAAAGLSVSPV
jgi:hypothetical protein